MVRPKRFTVELVKSDPDGQPSALCRDLVVDCKGRLRRLQSLTEDFLSEAQPMHCPAGREGAWIAVPLGLDVAVCQWDPGPKALWDLRIDGVGVLKVVRILRKRDFHRFFNRFEMPE